MLAERIRRDHSGIGQCSRLFDVVTGQVCRGIVDALAVLVDRVAEQIGLGDLHGSRLELIGQYHLLVLNSRLTLRLARPIAEEVIERGRR